MLYKSVVKINGESFSENDIASIVVSDMEEWKRSIFLFLKDWIQDSDAIVQKTSGSTGMPKNIKLKKQHMINSALLTISYFNLNTDSNFLLCLPAGYIAGKMMIVRAIMCKANLIILKPVKNVLDTVAENIDFMAVTPMQLYSSLQLIHEKFVKHVLVGGGAVDSNYENEIMQSHANIVHSYAMTETSSHVALRELNGDSKSNTYKALKGIEFTIDDRSCLQINAPMLLDAPIQTNDIVDLNSKKEFLWIGRADNIINSGGVKILPEHIENKIKGIIPCPYFIASLPDEELGEKLVLVLEKSFLLNQEKDMLITKMNKTLPKYHIPKTIIAVARFEWAENDKLLRTPTLRKITG